MVTNISVERSQRDNDIYIVVGKRSSKEERSQIGEAINRCFDDLSCVERYRDGERLIVIIRDANEEREKSANKMIASLFVGFSDEDLENAQELADAFEDVSDIVEPEPLQESKEESPGVVLDRTEILGNGAKLIIPDGVFKGKTVQQAYDEQWIYALAYLLLNAKKLQGMTHEDQELLYRYTVLFTKGAFEEIEDSSDDVHDTFAAILEAFEVFLRKELKKIGKTAQELLALPEREMYMQMVDIIDGLIDRMVISIAP